MPAVIDEPEIDVDYDTDTKTVTRHLPRYAVVVFNDDDHTFNYVIACFQKIFGYDVEKCFNLAVGIHENGREVVWTGSKEVAEFKKEQIENFGPDHEAKRKIEYPLKVELEPLPE